MSRWPGSDPIFPQQRLQRLAVIALGSGIAVQLVPRRRPSALVPALAKSTTSLRELTGFPILGVVFPQAELPPAQPPACSRSSRFLGQITLLAETILCLAMLVAIYASIRERTIAQRFIEQPFEAFGQSIQYAAASCMELLASGTPTRS